ncbi:MAG: hypothetical protein WD646_14150 [Actinomycetota bacterium]
MRKCIVLVFVAAFGLGLASVASAETLPDLPGMGPAIDATSGKAPESSTTKETANADAPADVDRMSAPDSEQVVQSTVDPDLTKTIRDLPGGGGLPIFGDVANAAAQANSAVPDVLLVLAAIGTATSIGMYWAVRRRFGPSRR